MVQAVQRAFQPPADRLEAGLQLLHHPHRHTGVVGHRYLVAVDAPVKEVKTRREEVRGERDGEGKRRRRMRERGDSAGIGLPESGLLNPAVKFCWRNRPWTSLQSKTNCIHAQNTVPGRLEKYIVTECQCGSGVELQKYMHRHMLLQVNHQLCQ